MRPSLRQVLFRSAGLDLNFAGGVFSLNNTRTSSPAAIPGWSFSRTDTNGTATALDLAGNVIQFSTGVPRITNRGILVEEARTNLLLNSATLSTQSVTTTAVAHTLSFYGTGTVTLTGTSTAGPLVGTGASNRVTLTFTATAGTLTLTVTGSVTTAQLELGAFATSPIITTGAAGTRGADVPIATGLALLNSTAPNTVVIETEWAVRSDTRIYAEGYTSGLAAGATFQNANGGTSPRLINRTGATRTDSGGSAAVISDGTVARLAIVSDGRLASQGVILTSGATPSQADWTGTLSIGNRYNIGAPLFSCCTYIRRVRVLPYAATDAQLQALTAP